MSLVCLFFVLDYLLKINKIKINKNDYLLCFIVYIVLVFEVI